MRLSFSEDMRSSIILGPEVPWPGPDAYDEESHAYFHGRSDEAAILLRMVRQNPLTVLYGKSGLGKSSLLQAGLFPRLRKENYVPLHVRLDLTVGDDNPLDQVLRQLLEELRERGVDFPEPEPGQS